MLGLIQLISISASIFIFVVVIELVRRNHLKERYSLIWLATSVMLIIFSVWRRLLDYIALKLGIYYPPSFLFLLAITFLIVLLLHFSTIISSLSERNKKLAQEMGIVKARLDTLEGKKGSSAGV
ncbi:MAG: DUF2304 domain-containing protein [Candidatus Sulfobium sp.]|jgi:hypothetical protein